jgi:methylated-DNA-[protein]-cysteine S-methyltransferase
MQAKAQQLLLMRQRKPTISHALRHRNHGWGKFSGLARRRAHRLFGDADSVLECDSDVLWGHGESYPNAALDTCLRAALAFVPVPQISLHTPVGDVSVSEEDGAIVSVDWGWGSRQSETRLLRRACDQLHKYFDQELSEFDLPLAPAGSLYQQRVWQALCAIPYGATKTYLDIARVAGGSPRSVGQANGNNPIPILIPCHRIVATTHIGGYSGGDGLDTKRWLFALEAQAPPLLRSIAPAAA